MKALIRAKKYDFIPRRKNMQALSQLGLTIPDTISEISSLTTNNYYKGPKPDFDPCKAGDIWEFKKNLGGTQLYIKVKVTSENGEDIVKCLGFHEDDFA